MRSKLEQLDWGKPEQTISIQLRNQDCCEVKGQYIGTRRVAINFRMRITNYSKQQQNPS